MELNEQCNEGLADFNDNNQNNITFQQANPPSPLVDIQVETTATIQSENEANDQLNSIKDKPAESAKDKLEALDNTFSINENSLDTIVDLSATKPNNFAENRANLGDLGTYEIDRIVAGRRRNGGNDYLVGVKYTTYHW